MYGDRGRFRRVCLKGKGPVLRLLKATRITATSDLTELVAKNILRLSEENEVSPSDLPISKSPPCRALCFLKRAKASPSKLLPARRKTSDCSGIQDFVKNGDG